MRIYLKGIGIGDREPVKRGEHQERQTDERRMILPRSIWKRQTEGRRHCGRGHGYRERI